MREITENLLEMHFQRAFVKTFETVFGARFLRLLKPSPQLEAWVGFDQAWVKTSLSTVELFDHLRDAMQLNTPQSTAFLLGYFLQFKVVDRIERRSRLAPATINPPYYRSELSLSPNQRTGLSQHETLIRLSQLPMACVNYVCPFLFSLDDIYSEPDLDRVQVVDVRTAPQGWATNQRHFVAFRSERDPQPTWCSEPIPGRSRLFREWVESEQGPQPLSGRAVLNLIQTTASRAAAAPERKSFQTFSIDPTGALAESFSILEFERVSP